jgi:hypothetical protein
MTRAGQDASRARVPLAAAPCTVVLPCLSPRRCVCSCFQVLAVLRIQHHERPLFIPLSFSSVSSLPPRAPRPICCLRILSNLTSRARRASPVRTASPRKHAALAPGKRAAPLLHVSAQVTSQPTPVEPPF